MFRYYKSHYKSGNTFFVVVVVAVVCFTFQQCHQKKKSDR